MASNQRVYLRGGIQAPFIDMFGWPCVYFFFRKGRNFIEIASSFELSAYYFALRILPAKMRRFYDALHLLLAQGSGLEDYLT
jgi:hypothetical protein